MHAEIYEGSSRILPVIFSIAMGLFYAVSIVVLFRRSPTIEPVAPQSVSGDEPSFRDKVTMGAGLLLPAVVAGMCDALDYAIGRDFLYPVAGVGWGVTFSLGYYLARRAVSGLGRAKIIVPEATPLAA